MNYPIKQLSLIEFPPLLFEIPEPPKQLFLRGNLPGSELICLAVVGSRDYTSYGKQVTETLVAGLREYPIAIVSGLALGIDAIAHQAALANNMYTLAVPGSGLSDSVLYPATNRHLADKILAAGGGLLSELPSDTKAATWTFPMRNRIMAGLSQATLLIEAGAKSGTLITARLAVDYNRELLAVPSSIFSSNSYGVHQFIKLGATVVTEAADIILALGLELEATTAPKAARPTLSPAEERILTLLHEPTDRDTLIRGLDLPISEANILLMQMEMRGYIRYDAPHYLALI